MPHASFPPPRRKLRHPESIEQRLFIKRARLDPRTRDLVIFAIPNGGNRGRIEAAIMKGEGVLAGVPDVFVATKMSSSFGNFDEAHGLFLEFKAGKNKPSPAQRTIIGELRLQRYAVSVVYSAEEAWNILCGYLRITP